MMNRTQVNKMIRKFTASGAEFTNWSKDGSGDSYKVEFKLNGKEFLVAMEKPTQLSVCSKKDYAWKETGSFDATLAAMQ